MSEITEEDPSKVLGKVYITVYNDCFSIEHTAGMTPEHLVELFVMALEKLGGETEEQMYFCLLYTSPSPRDRTRSRMPSSA